MILLRVEVDARKAVSLRGIPWCGVTGELVQMSRQGGSGPNVTKSVDVKTLT